MLGVITAELGAGAEDDGNMELMVDDMLGSEVVVVVAGVSVEEEIVDKICVAPLLASAFSRAKTTELVPC